MESAALPGKKKKKAEVQPYKAGIQRSKAGFRVKRRNNFKQNVKHSNSKRWRKKNRKKNKQKADHSEADHCGSDANSNNGSNRPLIDMVKCYRILESTPCQIVFILFVLVGLFFLVSRLLNRI